MIAGLIKALGAQRAHLVGHAWGGAIACGHPLASSGVRLMTQLSRHFAEHPEVRYGITTMCVGIGMGGTIVWENPHWNGENA